MWDSDSGSDAAPPKVSPCHNMTILNNIEMSMLEMYRVHMHLDRTHTERWRKHPACTALAAQPQHVWHSAHTNLFIIFIALLMRPGCLGACFRSWPRLQPAPPAAAGPGPVAVGMISSPFCLTSQCPTFWRTNPLHPQDCMPRLLEDYCLVWPWVHCEGGKMETSTCPPPWEKK